VEDPKYEWYVGYLYPVLRIVTIVSIGVSQLFKIPDTPKVDDIITIVE